MKHMSTEHRITVHRRSSAALDREPVGGARYFSVAELALRYRVHPTTIRRWLRGGEMASIRLPGGYRVPSQSVEAFEDSRLSR